MARLLRALGEPTRRRAYEAVRQARRPLTRAEVAERVGIGVRLAAFHLDKLVDEGLLTAGYARPDHRPGGPAGRPAKWYCTGPHRFEITVPPRRHDLAARILLAVVTRSSGTVDHDLRRAARECGRILALEGEAELGQLLTSMGYEPQEASDGSIDLVNCPFHELVDQARDTVCSMNLALLGGVTDATSSAYTATRVHRDGYCCVRLVPAAAAR